MEDAEYRKMFEYEDRHWWFRGKRAIVGRLVEGFAPARAGLRSLDVGCGTGANLQVLARHGEAYGLDDSPLALSLCRRRGLHDLARGSAASLPYRAATFDVVTLLDVLYHRRVADVGGTLREAHRVCRPGGVLIVTDSAFEALRSPHDVAHHAARRFRRGQIARTVEDAGFRVLKSSYMNALLFPIALAVRAVERRRFGDGAAHSSLTRPLPVINWGLGAIYGLEARILARASLPFGLSVLVVGRKPTDAAGRTRST